MNNTKLLFTDLDDTLLNNRKEITPENHRAISHALKEGHKIIINSGRPLIGITSQIDQLKLDRKGCYAVAYNGGLIYDCHSRETIYIQTLPLEDVRHIFQQAESFGLYCQTYDSQQVLTPRDTPELHDYAKRIGVPYRIDGDCPNNLTEEPVKVLVIGDESRKKLDAYRQAATEWARDRISIFYSNQTYLEHVTADVSKGNALRQLCRILDIPIENTIAVGDAENDISMIQAAHVGVAVANAIDSVKEIADYITTRDCNHDAVAEIIDKFILE